MENRDAGTGEIRRPAEDRQRNEETRRNWGKPGDTRLRLPLTVCGTRCGRAITLGLLVFWLVLMPGLVPVPGAGSATPQSCVASVALAGELPEDQPADLEQIAPDAGRESRFGSRRSPEFRALWVLRSTLVSRPQIDNMLHHAVSNGFNVLFVQVRGRGDALYNSRIEPRSELLGDTGFDPLAYVVERAHAVGLEVHVWLNAFLVWSAPQPPRSRDHVVLAHPDWIHVRADGRSLLDLSRAEIEGMGAEGVFLSPGNPEVRERLRAVVRELVGQYDIDGVHLDYIRYPSMEVGYDVASRTEFMRRYGVDPLDIERADREIVRLYGEAGLRDLQSLWIAWRSSSVTESVASVLSDLREIRPSLKLSAAVIADVTTATTRYGQNWPSWLESGLLDFAVPMCYSASTSFVRRQVNRIRGLVGDGTFYPGLAIYNQSPTRVVEKVRALRELGVGGFSFFCYDPDRQRSYTLRALGESVFGGREGAMTGGGEDD